MGGKTGCVSYVGKPNQGKAQRARTNTDHNACAYSFPDANSFAHSFTDTDTDTGRQAYTDANADGYSEEAQDVEE
jgi:hypothetical protein